MKKVSFIFILLLMSTFIFAQEVQTKFCDGSLIIDNVSAKKVTLFKDVPGFVEASIYKSPDGLMFIEVKYLKDGNLLREKRPITEGEISVICEELKVQTVNTRQDDADFGKVGRKRLIGSSMLASLGYYGWAIPFTFNANTGEAYIASYMIIGSAGFFIPFVATRDKEVTLGMAKGFRSGSLLGIAHGWMLSGAVFGNDFDTRIALGISTVTSIGEGLLGYSIAKRNNWNYNRTSSMAIGGYWGLGEGGALSYILNFEDARLSALTVLGFSGLGVYGGYIAGEKLSLSSGGLTVINTLGLLGASIPLGVVSAIDIGFNRGVAGFMVATSIAGLGYGIYHTNGINYTSQQGNIVGLGTLAGGLLGGGFAALTGSESLIVPTLGGFCGFLITDSIIRRDIGKTENNSKISMNIDFNPYPLMMGKKSSNLKLSNQQLAETSYLVKLRMTF